MNVQQTIQNVRASLRKAILRLSCHSSGRVVLKITYDDKHGNGSTRSVVPIRMLNERRKCPCGRGYGLGPLKCEAYCQTKHAIRHFFPHQMRIVGVRFQARKLG